MSTERSSLERAIARELGDEDGVLGMAASAEQLDLLRGADGKLPGNVYQLVRDQSKRGPGRPPNAGNRRNDMLAKLVTQQHGDPVMAMASLYSRPLDQLIELVLIADSTAEREERLLGLIDRAEELVSTAMKTITEGGGEWATAEAMNGVTRILDRVFDAAKALKMKPVEAVVSHRVDGVIVAPPIAAGTSVEDKTALLKLAGDGIARMLEGGRIDPRQLADYHYVNGQFVEADQSGDEPDHAG